LDRAAARHASGIIGIGTVNWTAHTPWSEVPEAPPGRWNYITLKRSYLRPLMVSLELAWKYAFVHRHPICPDGISLRPARLFWIQFGAKNQPQILISSFPHLNQSGTLLVPSFHKKSRR
jgi:hypothetical protein